MKIISFSLWGDDPKYCAGAIRNAELMRSIYPGWTARFYIADDVPGFYEECLSQMDVEIKAMPKGMDGWKGMFARFLPASEDDVTVFISRDCDSRITEREAQAVNRWLLGPKLIHVMRDHQEHSTPIMGGMWGAKQHAIPDMEALILQWSQEDRWQTDQEFLRDVIWPGHYHKVLAHDDWGRFPQAETKPFPTPREADDFIGSIIGPNDERLHPEHHASFTS